MIRTVYKLKSVEVKPATLLRSMIRYSLDNCNQTVNIHFLISIRNDFYCIFSIWDVAATSGKSSNELFTQLSSHSQVKARGNNRLGERHTKSKSSRPTRKGQRIHLINLWLNDVINDFNLIIPIILENSECRPYIQRSPSDYEFHYFSRS